MSSCLSELLPLLASAPEGIKKLRGLILELAVRGKLVPQDPDDEPAGELLKRIEKERARLEAEGARHKFKARPFGNEAEESFALPEGWQWVRFDGIAQHNSGKTLDKGRNSGEPRPYITTSNLYWGCFELGSVRQMLINGDELERCTARKNDLLICEGGEAGRAAVWPHDYEICFQNHVHRARFFGGIDPHYAYRFFEKLNASGEIDQYRKGVGISNMSGKALASIPFPLSPLAEQHRIVAKVDELMALCDRLEAEQADAEAAHARLVETLLGTLTQSTDAAELAANWQRLAEHFNTLFTTESSLDALKQTILQLAVMGKLVPQDPNDEPASELLKRIAKERARLEAEAICKRSKPLPAVREDEWPFDLPAGWEWVRLGTLLTKLGAGSTPLGGKQVYVNEGVKFLRSQNVWNDGLRLDDVALILPEVHLKMSGTHVEAGDLLFNITGASIGRCAVVPQSFDTGNVSQHVTIIRLVSPDTRQFMHTVLTSNLVQQTVMDVQVGVSREGLSIGKLAQFVIPLPPLPEQHRIVAKVDELMALCDRLKADLVESRSQQERLAATLIDAALQAA
jgi:type I restriction enzyme S subunit